MISFHREQAKNLSDGFELYEYEDESLARLIVARQWSPIIWGGIRSKKNFRYSDLCGLDFENPEVSLADMVNTFCDCWHIIGTTRNHQKVKGSEHAMDRFRIILKWSRRIEQIDSYEFNTKKMISDYGADPACFDGARMYFPCDQIVSINLDPDAERIDVVDVPKEYAAKRAESHRRFDEARDRYKAIGRMSTFARRWLLATIPQGERNIIVFQLGCELARTGLDYEDAVDRVLRSETYGGMVISPELHKKIRNQVFDGFKYVGMFDCSYADYCYKTKK